MSQWQRERQNMKQYARLREEEKLYGYKRRLPQNQRRDRDVGFFGPNATVISTVPKTTT